MHVKSGVKFSFAATGFRGCGASSLARNDTHLRKPEGNICIILREPLSPVSVYDIVYIIIIT
jgi:hypothetical protein